MQPLAMDDPGIDEAMSLYQSLFSEAFDNLASGEEGFDLELGSLGSSENDVEDLPWDLNTVVATVSTSLSPPIQDSIAPQSTTRVLNSHSEVDLVRSTRPNHDEKPKVETHSHDDDDVKLGVEKTPNVSADQSLVEMNTGNNSITSFRELFDSFEGNRSRHVARERPDLSPFEEVQVSETQTNLFIMLATSGNHLLPHSVAQEGIRWSCRADWMLCSIEKDGSPWELKNPSFLFDSLVRVLRLNCQATLMKSKILKDPKRVSDLLRREWHQYQRTRMLTLQTMGSSFLLQLLSTNDKEHRTIPVHGRHGLLYKNHSCVLDCILFIFPRLFWHIVKSKLHEQTGNSRHQNASRAPGNILLSLIMKKLYEIRPGTCYREATHRDLSDHLRVLMQDLAGYFRKCRNPLPREWSPFKQNNFLNMYEATWYILPRLLGAHSHTCFDSRLEYRRLTLRNMKNARDCSTLPEFFLKNFRDSFADNCEGCYCVTLLEDIGQRNEDSFKALLDSNPRNAIEGYDICIQSFIGYAFNSSRTHFIAAIPFVSQQKRIRLFVYDGMQNNGLPQAVTVKKCFLKKDPLFSLSSLFVFAVCTKLHYESDCK